MAPQARTGDATSSYVVVHTNGDDALDTSQSVGGTSPASVSQPKGEAATGPPPSKIAKVYSSHRVSVCGMCCIAVHYVSCVVCLALMSCVMQLVCACFENMNTKYDTAVMCVI